MPARFSRRFAVSRASVSGGLVVLALALATAPAAWSLRADAAVLYDPTLGGGSQTLADQGWLFPSGTGAAVTATPSGTLLDTMANRSIQAGYSTHNPIFKTPVHPSAPVLDRSAGFVLSFDLALAVEDHDPNKDDNGDGKHDRAGFSVLVVTSDLRAIELGFFASDFPNNPNGIWAQADAPLFTQAEGADVTLAPVGTMVRYHLTILGNQYSLRAETTPGSTLTGSLRDYTAWPGIPVPPFGTFDPYDTANLIFFGDDTTSAGAVATIGRIEITPVPEPGSLALLGAVSAFLVLFALWRRAASRARWQPAPCPACSPPRNSSSRRRAPRAAADVRR